MELNTKLTVVLILVSGTLGARPGGVQGAQENVARTDVSAPEWDSAATNTQPRARVPSRAIITLAVASVLAVPFDESIRDWFQGPQVQDSGFASRASHTLSSFGGFAPLAVGGATYIAAEVLGQTSVADIALHTTVGVVLAGGATMTIKALVGRQRPYVGFGHLSFELGDGTETRDQRSFPSGHATTVFALAAGLTTEARHLWPNHARMIAAVLYPVAGLTAVSRVFDDEHWTSDVVFGSGVGLLVATWYSNRSHHDTGSGPLGGVSVDLTPSPQGGLGVLLGWQF